MRGLIAAGMAIAAIFTFAGAAKAELSEGLTARIGRSQWWAMYVQTSEDEKWRMAEDLAYSNLRDARKHDPALFDWYVSDEGGEDFGSISVAIGSASCQGLEDGVNIGQINYKYYTSNVALERVMAEFSRNGVDTFCPQYGRLLRNQFSNEIQRNQLGRSSQ